MPDEERDPMEDYQERLSQYELTKQIGAEAYADAIIGMLPNKISEDKAIQIREGLKAILGGPPNLSFPHALQFPPPAQVDAEFEPPPSPYFTETAANGITTTYDFMAISQAATHIHRHPDGMVVLMYGEEIVMSLKGEAAQKLWEWQQRFINNYEASMSGRPVFIGGPRR